MAFFQPISQQSALTLKSHSQQKKKTLEHIESNLVNYFDEVIAKLFPPGLAFALVPCLPFRLNGLTQNHKAKKVEKGLRWLNVFKQRQ